MTRISAWFFAGLALFLAGTVAVAENLALGKPYTLKPPPNYRLCTDPGDATQLTDGEYTSGRLWTQRGTVGWEDARPVVITIDLGAVQPIGGVSFNTAAGVAGVEWPRSITILVSDDGRDFYRAGELVSLSAKVGEPPRSGYAVHRFHTDELRTHGRYVAFFVLPEGKFVFSDEIEVYKGDAAFLDVPYESEITGDLKVLTPEIETQNGILWRISQDALAVRKAIAGAGIASAARDEMLAQVSAVERDLPDVAHHRIEADFRAVLPLNALHERLFGVQAHLWRALKREPWTVWQTEPYAPISVVDVPPAQGGASINIAMMSNEYRAGTFNVSGATEVPVTLGLRIQGLPGGDNPSYVKVHEVLWTDTRYGHPVASALPEVKVQADGYSILAVPGLTRQIWLSFHPTDVPAGSYEGKVVILAGSTQLAVPIHLHVYPLSFPDHPSLHLGGFDDTDTDGIHGLTLDNRAAVMAYLKEHFVDTPWGLGGTLRPTRFDSAGNLTSKPNTAKFDEWVRRWPDARQFCVLSAVAVLHDVVIDTPGFDAKVGSWVRFWAEHAEQCGLKPGQLVMEMVDEPRSAKQDKAVLAWAAAIKAAHTGIKIWENPNHKNPLEADQEMMADCDVLCPNRVLFLHSSQSYRDYFAKQREQGKELAFYSCDGPSTTLDPYTYYRLQAWSCWRYGALSSYFWSFCDAGDGSTWNEYAAKGKNFVPYFLDSTSVTPGKLMEAVREGVEDYEYLAMLQSAVAKGDRPAANDEAVQRAKRLLETAPVEVCDAADATVFKWDETKDRSGADRARIEILEALTALQAEGHQGGR